MVNRIYASSFLLLPGRCILCASPSGKQDICTACTQDLPWQHNYCEQCALPLPDTASSPCGQCLRQPPTFSRCIAAWNYQTPVNWLISDFKYRRELSYGKVMATLLAQTIKQRYQSRALPQAIIPTPLHWRRRMARRFNQSEYLARDLARALQLPCQQLLKRQQPTASQQALDAESRHRNVRCAFTASNSVKEKCIAVVDDVVTTGATANAMARTLLKAGAREVHIWCLARTPLP